jgi:hypothetical protein
MNTDAEEKRIEKLVALKRELGWGPQAARREELAKRTCWKSKKPKKGE